MAEIEPPYLWFATGRSARYANYRRDGVATALKSEKGDALKEGDPRITAAWVRAHEKYEAKKARQAPRRESWAYKKSIAHAVDDWLKEAVPLLSKNTQKSYSRFAREIRAEHGHRPAATTPRDAIVKMVNERAKRTPGSANNLRIVLGTLFSYIEDHPTTYGLPDNWRNPTVGKSRRKKLTKTLGWAPWEESQIAKFRAKWPMRTRERALFETYLNTGQRGCDIARMMRDQIHDGRIVLIQQKTGERVWIPISDDLDPVLDIWLASHNYAPLFPSTYGKTKGQALSVDSVEQILHEAIGDAGLPTSCKAHGLRYTFATRAIELSKVEKRISHQTLEAIVGHRTLQMAIKYTQKIRDAELTISTMNRNLPTYAERHSASAD